MTDNRPLISVIVPIYNIEKYLPRCLQAISAQTYRNLEIILVDDGSTDCSGILCDDFAAKDSRARVIHQPNTGLWAARNTGQDEAHGEFLFFPDGDDYFHQDLIRILYEAIISGNGYDLALCRFQKTESPGAETSSSVSVLRSIKNQEELFHNLFHYTPEDYFSHHMWNKLFRHHLIKDLHTNPYPVSEDLDYLIRFYMRIQNAILIDNVLYYWVQRPQSIRHLPSFIYQHLENNTRVFYRNFLSLPKDGMCYAHYLLESLYLKMLFWRNRAWLTPNRNNVVSECKTMVRDTWKAFIQCRDIPLWKRLACFVLALFPRVSRWVFVLSGN